MGASSWVMRFSKESIRYVALCRLLRSGWLLGSSAVWICIHHSVRQYISNASDDLLQMCMRYLQFHAV